MTKKYDFKFQTNIDDNNGNGFAANEIETIRERRRAAGGTDGVVFISVVRTLVGNNNNVPIIGLDAEISSVGLSTQEKFCVWCLLARNLLKDPDLPDFVRDVYETALKQNNEFDGGIREENPTIN